MSIPTNPTKGELTNIEKLRRNGDYKAMESAASRAFAPIQDDKSSDAGRARSRIFYELHQAEFQKATAAIRCSLDFAQMSIGEASAAFDPVGVLLGKMNLYRLKCMLGFWEEARAELEQLRAEAEALGCNVELSDEDDRRYARAMQTILAFSIDDALEHGAHWRDVRIWLGRLHQNEIYREFGMGEEGERREKAAQAYVDAAIVR